MTQNQDKPSSLTAQGRATRRGLGAPPDLGHDARKASGAFPRPWPELDDSDEGDALGSSAAHPPLERAPEEATRVFDGRQQSRGPEYHPPSVPGASRERGFASSGTSGTFRVSAPSVQVRVPSDSDGRPSSPTSPPLERFSARPFSARPALAWFGSKRFLGSALIGLVLGGGLALGVVRVPVRALGILKTSGVPESLGATVTGSVGAVQVAAGSEVEPGDAVLQIHSPELERALEARRAELELMKSELDAAAQEDKAALGRNLYGFERRRQLLGQRLELKDSEIAQRQALVQDVTALVNAGSVPATDLASANAAVQAASEARLGIALEMSELEIELTDRRSQQQERDRQRRSRLAEAETKLRDAEDAVGASTVRAPASGWIESLLVTPGSTVQVGAELARLVPRSAPRSVVALVALEDAAGVAVGEEASVELSPRNQNEGALAARIKHVSREVAPAARVQAILGGPSPGGFVQLELELLDSTEYHELEPKLRTGSRALVSFSTPHRRLGSVLYEATREWLSFGAWR